MANLTNSYRYWRQRGNRAAIALAKARDDIAAGKARYPSAPLTFNPRVDPARSHGWKDCRWIESASDGLRLVGFADELAGLRHTGWYGDADQCEIYRGIVYQLPGKGRRARYVYGYADPHNEGSAFLCFDIEQGEILESSWDDDGDAKREAARHADSMAESFADDARKYDEACQSARLWEELGENMAAFRAKARELVRDMRAAIKAGHSAPASICSALRDKLRDYLEQWEEARRERETLSDNFHYWEGGRPIGIAAFAAMEL